MLNCQEIYDRGGESTIIFKEHLILRKGMKTDSIMDIINQNFNEYNVTKLNKKELFVEPQKGSISKKEIETVKELILNTFNKSCRLELIMDFIPYEKGLIISIK